MFEIRLAFLQIRKFSSQVANKELKHKISSFALTKSDISDASKVIPELSSYSEIIWHRSHEAFANHGIATSYFLQIVTNYPEILVRQQQQITKSFELWRSCQFGEKNLLQLITAYPYLLDIVSSNNGTNASLLKKIAFLRSFVTSNKNVWKLLMNSPNLITDNDDVIEEKFKYLKNTMRIEIPEICKSAVFSKTLDEIKCRHVFLDRLGMFKPRSLKSNVTTSNELSNNPRLHKIVDTSDKNFATKISSTTLLEYGVFKELFKRELLERSIDDVDSSDSEE